MGTFKKKDKADKVDNKFLHQCRCAGMVGGQGGRALPLPLDHRHGAHTRRHGVTRVVPKNPNMVIIH